jgi:hypothetical protein
MMHEEFTRLSKIETTAKFYTESIEPKYTEKESAMSINSKCGKYSVNIIWTGNTFLAIANINTFDSETMSDTSYWFTIGRYKTEKGAIRQAIKKMASHNVYLDIA